jgi:hypothetical protein
MEDYVKWHVELTGNKRDTCRILVRQHEGKRPLGIPRRRREEYIKNISPKIMMRRGMDLMFVDPCVILQFIKKNPTRR